MSPRMAAPDVWTPPGRRNTPRPWSYRAARAGGPSYPRTTGKAPWPVARIRSIKPEFWDDEAVGSLTRDARLLFVATWTFADDEGLLRWSPSYLKASALMYDDVPGGDVLRWMNELEELGFVFSYGAGRGQQRIGYIVNFRKHQRIDKPQPGRLPPPPLSDPAVILMYARRDEFICHLCRESVNREMATRPLDPYDPGSDDLTGFNPSPDHLVPRSKGGSDYPTNIKTAHVACNKGRGNRPVEKAQVRQHSQNGSESIPGTFAEPSTPDWKGREGKGDVGALPLTTPNVNPEGQGQDPPHGNLATPEPRTDRNTQKQVIIHDT